MFRKTTLFTLLIALVIIVLSAYVRLSSTGDAACTHWQGWPGCYEKASFYSDQQTSIADFVTQLVMDGEAQAYLVQNSYIGISTLLAILVGFLVVTSFGQKQGRYTTFSLLGVLAVLAAVNVGLGFWIVEDNASSLVVTGQIFSVFFTFWLLFWIYLRANPAKKTAHQSPLGLGAVTLSAIYILLIQIAIGFVVSTNQAGLACVGFPQCNGVWVPDVSYSSVIQLFSGINSGVERLSLDGQIFIHWVHRLGALVCFAMLTLVMLLATAESRSKPVKVSGIFLSLLLLIQVLLGVFSVKLELPLWATTLHHTFAAVLMLPLIAISYYKKYTLDDFAHADVAVPVTKKSDAHFTPDEEAVDGDVQVGPTDETLYLRLKTQLKKTRSGLGGILSAIPLGQKEISEDLLEEIEASLLMADVGIEATTEIISQLTESIDRDQLNDSEALEAQLKNILRGILEPCSQKLEIPQQDTPFVILVVGINGVGKTTTIGKMAKRLQQQGHSVMLAAGDTFRAAAVEQLETWGERNNIHVVAQHTGADSASVIYDGVQSAQAKGVDVLIADTAGRLHTKSNLMEELSKIKRIMAKVDPSAPHEVLLVLDAGTGQNALLQAKIFNETVALSGLALTKLDGTAKGGVIFALAREMGLAIRYIGVGEGIDDLQDFNATAFVDALFVKD
jgi:fused signal recognition particle receptor